MCDMNEQSFKSVYLRAGVAKREITTNAEEAVVKDPLYAKALVLDDGKTKIVIIGMDTTAIGGRQITQGILGDVGEEFLPELRNRIQQELSIPGDHVLVNASHTHPPDRILCNDTEQVIRTFDAVKRAVQNMTEVTIGAGCGYEDRITINRTLRLKDGHYWTVRHTNPCPPDEEVEDVGPIDPQIGILRIDRTDGRPLAVVYNFACHPLFGDIRGRITADFPAVASRVIEENIGQGAMAIFLQGAGGNVVDVLFKDFERPRDIEPFGNTLGLSTLKAWRKIPTQNVTLNMISEIVQLPRRTDIPVRIQLLHEEQAQLLKSLMSTSLNFKSFLPLYMKYMLNPDYPLDYSYRYLHARKIGSDDFEAMDALNKNNIIKYYKNICVMEKLARIQDKIATLKKHHEINEESGETTINAEVQGIRIGEFVLITSPAEVLIDVGLNIKKSSPYKHTFIAAFSNGYIHYGPPVNEYEKGGYEVTECLLGPEWQQIYEGKVGEIIARL